jgi:hypothetical protein
MRFLSCRAVFISHIAVSVFALAVLAGCGRKLGWGVLLWANEKTGIPSGTVLPVYIRSNIEKKWVVGVPKEYRGEEQGEKLEIPLSQLELVGGKGSAKKYAAEFAEYARVYAETLQDGLPIRAGPDNNAARVYRLRIGEIIKIISPVEGTPAMSTTGAPLPGEWYRVLTEDGTRGFCFSYRLRLFDHSGGQLNFAYSDAEPVDDALLQSIQAKIWSAEVYETMLNTRKFDLDALSKRWGFSTGEDTGIANVYTGDIDRSFQYSAIRSIGENAWRFDGSPLTMTLFSDTFLTVQFIDRDGMNRSANFVALPVSVDDLIAQEEQRREALYAALYAAGPEFVSASCGTLTLTENADFIWEGYEILVPDVIPISALGRGKLEIRYTLDGELEERYDGLATMRFKAIGSGERVVNFLYKIGGESVSDGTVSFEYVAPEYLKDGAITGKDEPPLLIYFFKAQ